MSKKNDGKNENDNQSSQPVTKRKRGNPALKKGGPALNPKGRPKGVPDSRSLFRKALDQQPGEGGKSGLDTFIQKVIARANKGDPAAMRIVAERISAPMKAKDDPVSIPGMDTRDHAKAADAVIAALGRGDITPTECSLIMSVLRDRLIILEGTEWEKRISELEAKLNGAAGVPKKS